MHKQLLVTALAAAVIAGCSTPAPKQAYREPASGSTAQLTFRNETNGRVSVAVYMDANACTNRRALPDLLLGEQHSIAIPAGKPQAFTIQHKIPNRTFSRTCQVTASFEVNAGEHYVAAIRPFGDDSCTVHLASVERGGVTATLREPLKAKSEAGPFCTGLP